MKSDPKECLYCTNNQTLHDLMIEIAPLSVSRVFLFKEQTYRGRCLVAYKDHVNDLFELTPEERNAFMDDVTRVTRAMDKVFHPEKINYGAYSDKLSHLHFHLAPKYDRRSRLRRHIPHESRGGISYRRGIRRHGQGYPRGAMTRFLPETITNAAVAD